MRIQYGKKEGFTLFRLVPLTPSLALSGFSCPVDEYNEYLYNDALRSQDDHIARTWPLRERASGKIAAYMSLIMDSIKLSFTEKELHNLNYPFKTIPAMKIAKLAVDVTSAAQYKGIGSYMIEAAKGKALFCNEDCCAARFLTVDADIEHDKGVLTINKKNGFIPNAENKNKNRKKISMGKELYK
jgi:hypothetical protein